MGQQANASLWGVQWIADHAASQKAANKPVLMGTQHMLYHTLHASNSNSEEFGVVDNQTQTYPGWYNEVISSGLTGDLIWQAGSYLSTGPTSDDGYAVYPNSTVYVIQESAAAALKAARG